MKFSILILFLVLPLSAARLKRVIVLEFKNLDKNPNFQYLEGSLTEAIKTDLKTQFKFKEMPPPEWEKAATDNNFSWPEENYTKGFAINLGRATNQEVVIGGYFQAVPSRVKGRGHIQVVRVNVFILDIGGKKLISEFDEELPTDGRLFDSINKLAARVASESKSVLPSEQEMLKQGSVLEPASLNEAHVGGGANFVSVPAAFSDNFVSGASLYPKDVPVSVQIEAGYSRHDFYKPRWVLRGVGSVQFGSTNFKVSRDTKTIAASLLGFSTAAHAGYRFERSRFYLMPFGGFGFFLGRMNLDYTTLTVLPTTTAGAEKSNATANLSAPFVEAGAQVGVHINPVVSLAITLQYRQLIYIGSSAGQLYAGAGVNFRL